MNKKRRSRQLPIKHHLLTISCQNVSLPKLAKIQLSPNINEECVQGIIVEQELYSRRDRSAFRTLSNAAPQCRMPCKTVVTCKGNLV